MGKNTRLTGPSTTADIPKPEPGPSAATPEPEFGPGPAVEPALPETQETVQEETEPEPEAEPEPAGEEEPSEESEEPVVPRPAGNAPTSDWAAYVTSLGYTGSVVGRTRAGLIRIADQLEAGKVDG